jgi:hypothetical protein
MDMRILERNTKIHRAFADSFIASFNRTWQRPLTAAEISTIESVPLCLTFMRLEVLGVDLDRIKTTEDANRIFESIAKDVSAFRDEAMQAFEAVAKNLGLLLAASPQANLLVLEEQLLTHVRSAELRA